MLINVFCKDRGWLFEDLKQEIAAHGAVPSEDPLLHADAWICLRSTESNRVPDRKRAVVQIHDVKTYIPIKGFGAISFVHQHQKDMWPDWDGKHLVLPIGSRHIPYCHNLPERPTIGFFCREIKGQKRSSMFRDAVILARKKCDFDVLMIGENLEHISDIGKYELGSAGPEDYKRINAMVTCSVSPMIPLSAYETCSAGRTVITTPRIWPSGTNWEMVKTGQSMQGIAQHIVDTIEDRRTYTPETIYNRKDWAKAQVQLAKGLI